MYCTWESIVTDNDDDGRRRQTLNLSYYLNDCEDVSFHDARFKQGGICNIIHWEEIHDVLLFMHNYE
jgi:hypothetical protein